MQHDSPFDRRIRRLRRDRAARMGSQADEFDRVLADELIDRLDLVTRGFADALVLGPAGKLVAERLRARGTRAIRADAGYQAASRDGGVQCDEDLLPFASQSFDLVISAGGLDSVNDLPGALALVRRTLRPDGLFLAAFAGAGSLPRLREAMLAGDSAAHGAASPHIHPQIDVRAAGDLLGRAGFAMPVADSHTLTIRFSSLAQLVRDLRAVGATNILRLRPQTPVPRSGLAAAASRFASAAGEDGKVAELVEIICLTGWAPGPDQPRPAARGSGKVSLATALKPSGTS
jgi:SAM-dependent methyltransferase